MCACSPEPAASWPASVAGWQWARGRLSPALLSTERCGAVGVGPEEGREDAQSGTAALPWHRSPTAISSLITVMRGTSACLGQRPARGASAVGPSASKGTFPGLETFLQWFPMPISRLLLHPHPASSKGMKPQSGSSCFRSRRGRLWVGSQ